MNLTATLLNDILAMFQQFGPTRAIPVEDRWKQAYPDASGEELQQWRIFCEELEKYALTLAHQVQNHKLDEKSAVLDLKQKYPDLSNRRLGDTFHQALYFAMSCP